MTLDTHRSNNHYSQSEEKLFQHKIKEVEGIESSLLAANIRIRHSSKFGQARAGSSRLTECSQARAGRIVGRAGRRAGCRKGKTVKTQRGMVCAPPDSLCLSWTSRWDETRAEAAATILSDHTPRCQWEGLRNCVDTSCPTSIIIASTTRFELNGATSCSL